MSLLGSEIDNFVRFNGVFYKAGSVEALVAVEAFITDYIENSDNDLMDMVSEKLYLRNVIPMALFGSAHQDFDTLYSALKIKRLQKVIALAKCCGNCKHEGPAEYCKLVENFIGYGDKGCRWKLKDKDFLKRIIGDVDE